MYDSALSEWTAAKMGPCRDVVGELAAAAQAHGLAFGLSFHREGGLEIAPPAERPCDHAYTFKITLKMSA